VCTGCNWRPVAGSCERGNEQSCGIKCGDFLDYLSDS
jgi:hypothetical protein